MDNNVTTLIGIAGLVSAYATVLLVWRAYWARGQFLSVTPPNPLRKMLEIPSELSLQKLLSDYIINQLFEEGYLEDELCEISQKLALTVVNPENKDMACGVAGEINNRLAALLRSAYANQLKEQ